MSGKTLIGLAIAAAVGGVASMASAQEGSVVPGAVQPCSLAGINPADHPGIFGDPVVAREQYGFVRGPDGDWQVIPNCESQVRR